MTVHSNISKKLPENVRKKCLEAIFNDEITPLDAVTTYIIELLNAAKLPCNVRSKNALNFFHFAKSLSKSSLVLAISSIGVPCASSNVIGPSYP